MTTKYLLTCLPASIYPAESLLIGAYKISRLPDGERVIGPDPEMLFEIPALELATWKNTIEGAIYEANEQKIQQAQDVLSEARVAFERAQRKVQDLTGERR